MEPVLKGANVHLLKGDVNFINFIILDATLILLLKPLCGTHDNGAESTV